MIEILAVVAALTAAFAALIVGLYFAARWLFMRAADRAAARIERLLNRVAVTPAAAAAGRVASFIAREAADRTPSGFARYARAKGMDEAAVRRDFQRTVERLARLMDTAVRLPVIGPVGLDALLGLVPFVGDAASAAVSLALVARTLKYGLPRELVARMLANVLIDALMGAVPILGDLADLWFRANARNARLVREYLEKE